MTVAVERPSANPARGQPGPAPRERLIAGRFRLIEQLGRGGMGRVYRAHDEVLDRPVAVKLIYDDAVRDREVEHACAVEARAAARLNHPGIVRILDSGFDDGHCYVVMSLAEGRTLSEILREDGPLAVDRALDLTIQVADALAAAHQQGVIHCDVKPGNLLVDSHWRVRLVDFGIARITSSTTGLTGELLQGSAQYLAPEQVEGAPVDGRTDLYALGTVLYETLAGRTPFGGGTIASILARRLVNDPPSIRESNPTVPPQVDQILLKALARNPDERFQTAADLRDALMAIRQTVPMFPAPARTQRQGAGRLRLLRPALAGAAIARAGREHAHQAIRHGAAQAADWSTRSGRWARRVGGTVLPDAMTRAQLLTPARRPTLRAGVGLAVAVGLLVGTTAAKCGVAGVSAESAIVAKPPPITTVERPAAATATLVPVPAEAAPLAESAAPLATEPTPVPPTATVPARTATSEPAVAEVAPTATQPPPAPAAPRAPVRALSAPPARVPAAPAAAKPAPPSPADKTEKEDGPADQTEKEDGDKQRNNLSNTPRSDEKTPEERAKADAKKNEEEKRAEPARPARASTLAPYVEPARQQAPPTATKPARPRSGDDKLGPAPPSGNAKPKNKEKEKD